MHGQGGFRCRNHTFAPLIVFILAQFSIPHQRAPVQFCVSAAMLRSTGGLLQLTIFGVNYYYFTRLYVYASIIQVNLNAIN